MASFCSLVVVCALWVCLAHATNSAVRVQLEPNQQVSFPEGWSVLGSADKSKIIPLTFAIKLTNLDALDKLFWAVSDPRSSAYGQHLSLAAVDAMTSPSSTSVRAVSTWLQQHGVDSSAHCKLTLGRGFLACEMPVATAEELLQVSFVDVSHAQWPTPIARADRAYSLPADVASHLDFVGNVHRLPSFRFQPRSGVPIIGVTPNVLRDRYNLTKDDVGSATGNSQAVASFLNQFINQADLTEFFNQFGNRFKHRDKIDKIVGPDPPLSGVEAALDVEYIMSLGANIETWFWSTPGKREGQEPFLDWIVAVGNTSGAPPVHSASYGDDEDSLDVPYMTRINAEFQKLGARGFSIMFASGDDGAGCNRNNTLFVPNFPASSPYVTAVGGTLFANLGKAEDGNYISGGGFSNVFAQPEYQTLAVNQFLSTSKRLPDAKYYNATGRAYPDVAAASNGFWVIFNKVPLPVAGTSCAAPTFSGIVAMLNDVRIAAGKSKLGFLNPFLYQNDNLLYDVVDGCNAGCQGTGFCSQAGWDPVTGIGTPDFARLKQLVLAL